MDWKKALDQAQRSVSSTYDTGVEAVLDRLGLEPRKTNMEIMLPALAVFGAGITVGAVLGVLFAPKRGEDLRNDIRHRISDIRDRGAEEFEETRARGEQLIETAREKIEA